MTLTPIYWLVLLLAVARLTRLVTRDYITQPFRRWVQRHAPDKLAYLVSCPWCASFWIAGVVVPPGIVWHDNRAVLAALVALGCSYATGLLNQLDGLEPHEGE